MEIFKDLWVFSRARKKFWLWPILGMMLFLKASISLAEILLLRSTAPRSDRKTPCLCEQETQKPGFWQQVLATDVQAISPYRVTEDSNIQK